ncbi:orotate phosphoribosyltransferase [Candidatus Marinamargulisbacteria bacterium SCGC AG-410-N11]|nr:orotate phosphoribosyltransferase [Candidatus Marinamargulisbacteria bacterium SCGC AG-410-N11]
MESYQREFIDLCIQNKILKFGNFTLKSGRKSPYFFNAGLFTSGSIMRQVGKAYATVLSANNQQDRILFGPAYKGIPLVVATAMALNLDFQQDVQYSYNRKEVKDHGEGGQLVGADINGKSVVVLDDVVTAGTAFRETMTQLESNNASCSALILALDRQEKGKSSVSTVQELKDTYQVPVYSIITLADILKYLKEVDNPELAQYSDQINQYRQQYSVA